MKAVANVSMVKSASVTGIQQVLFANGSITVATASYPDYDAGSLVMKLILTRLVHSNGVGNA